MRLVILYIIYSVISLSIIRAETLRATILLYHGLTDRCPEDFYQKRTDRFYRDMEYIRDHFDVISLPELQDIIEKQTPLKRNTVVITFDDGLRSDYLIAAPVLKEFGFPATFFIVTDWREDKDYMTWAQVKELSQVKKDGAYLFNIGSHSCSHKYPGLKNLTGDALKHELEDSKKAIEQHIAPRLCTSFAVPYGNLPPDPDGFRKMAAALGYQVIRTSSSRNINIATAQLLNLPCLPLYDFTEPGYIGAFNQSPVSTPFFEPAQDVYVASHAIQSYTLDVAIRDITSYHSEDSQKITIEAEADDDALVQSIEVIHKSPWSEATLHILTKAGAYGRTKVHIKASEPGTFPSGGYFYITIENLMTGSEPPSRHDLQTLFPNPATDHIWIQNADATVTYKIYNPAGNLLQVGTGNLLDVSALPAGVYIVVVDSGKNELARLKFVK